MTVLELHLDERTIERARDLAARQHLTVESLIGEIVKRLTTKIVVEDSILGMFSQEPELMDAVLENAMTARETDSLRVVHG